jgi:hypothetical protein
MKPKLNPSPHSSATSRQERERARQNVGNEGILGHAPARFIENQLKPISAIRCRTIPYKFNSVIGFLPSQAAQTTTLCRSAETAATRSPAPATIRNPRCALAYCVTTSSSIPTQTTGPSSLAISTRESPSHGNLAAANVRPARCDRLSNFKSSVDHAQTSPSSCTEIIHPGRATIPTTSPSPASPNVFADPSSPIANTRGPLLKTNRLRPASKRFRGEKSAIGPSAGRITRAGFSPSFSFQHTNPASPCAAQIRPSRIATLLNPNWLVTPGSEYRRESPANSPADSGFTRITPVRHPSSDPPHPSARTLRSGPRSPGTSITSARIDSSPSIRISCEPATAHNVARAPLCAEAARTARKTSAWSAPFIRLSTSPGDKPGAEARTASNCPNNSAERRR